MQSEHTSSFSLDIPRWSASPQTLTAAFLPCYTKGRLQKVEGNALKKKKKKRKAKPPQLVQLPVNIEFKVLF